MIAAREVAEAFADFIDGSTFPEGANPLATWASCVTSEGGTARFTVSVGGQEFVTVVAECNGGGPATCERADCPVHGTERARL